MMSRYVPKFFKILGEEFPHLPNGKADISQLKVLATELVGSGDELVMDSLGRMRMLSKLSLLENAVVNRCYAFWMVGVLADHNMPLCHGLGLPWWPSAILHRFVLSEGEALDGTSHSLSW